MVVSLRPRTLDSCWWLEYKLTRAVSMRTHDTLPKGTQNEMSLWWVQVSLLLGANSNYDGNNSLQLHGCHNRPPPQETTFWQTKPASSTLHIDSNCHPYEHNHSAHKRCCESKSPCLAQVTIAALSFLDDSDTRRDSNKVNTSLQADLMLFLMKKPFEVQTFF